MPSPEIVQWIELSVLLYLSLCSFDCSSGSQEPEILLSLQLDTGHLSLPWMDGWMDGIHCGDACCHHSNEKRNDGWMNNFPSYHRQIFTRHLPSSRLLFLTIVHLTFSLVLCIVFVYLYLYTCICVHVHLYVCICIFVCAHTF